MLRSYRTKNVLSNLNLYIIFIQKSCQSLYR